MLCNLYVTNSPHICTSGAWRRHWVTGTDCINAVLTDVRHAANDGKLPLKRRTVYDMSRDRH